MSYEWKSIKALRFHVQKVLPLVYDDTLSYYELLNKVVVKLNDLIENNENIPDFISGIISDFITSGELAKVVSDIISDFILNVKYPPEGITPAVGDGSADDTEAIRECLDYAKTNNMCLYFPSGKYLTDSLEVTDTLMIKGDDRYTSVIVLKGGATKPLISGELNTLSISNIGFDANADVQVNNIDLLNCEVNSGIITNAYFTDGDTNINLTVNGDMQISDTIVDRSLTYGIKVSGEGYTQADNIIFKQISAINGTAYLEVNGNKNIFEQLKLIGACDKGVIVNGNNNVIKLWKTVANNLYVDNGTDNDYEIYTEKSTIKDYVDENIDTTKDYVNEKIGETNAKIDTANVNIANNTEAISNLNTTVENLQNRIVYVEDFGAVGDGVTNDTAAIQAAIDSVDLSGGEVVFGNKTYAVDHLRIMYSGTVLKGIPSTKEARGTVLIAASTNTDPLVSFDSDDMTTCGGIVDMALMGNNNRQNLDTAVNKIGLYVKNRAELILTNVFISGFIKGGIYCLDTWDSRFIGVEIRACGVADINPALYFGSDDDSCNSIHCFGMHIEECPYQMRIADVSSHIQFVACKFEGGASYGEANVGERWNLIDEGVYSVTFDSCFFSNNANAIWLDVRNNETIFTGCQFSKGHGTLIKNASATPGYGNGLIINACSFEGFGQYEDRPLYIGDNNIISNCRFDMYGMTKKIYVAGSYCSITGNQFNSKVENNNPIFEMVGTHNSFANNRYNGCHVLWVGNKDNKYDNMHEYTSTKTAPFIINFQDAVVTNIFYNNADAITLGAANFQHPSYDARFGIYVNQGSITLGNDIVQGGTVVAAGEFAKFQYVNQISKFKRIN